MNIVSIDSPAGLLLSPVPVPHRVLPVCFAGVTDSNLVQASSVFNFPYAIVSLTWALTMLYRPPVAAQPYSIAAPGTLELRSGPVDTDASTAWEFGADVLSRGGGLDVMGVYGAGHLCGLWLPVIQPGSRLYMRMICNDDTAEGCNFGLTVGIVPLPLDYP